MPTTLYEAITLTGRISQERWLSQELFSFPWFFNIITLALIYALWIKLVDRKRLRELLLFGSFIAVSAAIIDLIATSQGLWEYTNRVFPIYPATFPFDFTVVPILYMLVMQYTSTWKSFLLGSVIASGIFSFIISPIYIWVGTKVYHNFNYVYMFLLVFIDTLVLRAIYNWVTSIEQGQIKVAKSSATILHPATAKPLPKDDNNNDRQE